MEYMQYGMIALGLATIIIAAFVRYRVKVRLPPSLEAAGVLMYFNCMLHCSTSCLLTVKGLEQEGLKSCDLHLQ